jgi:hypothetical protein
LAAGRVGAYQVLDYSVRDQLDSYQQSLARLNLSANENLFTQTVCCELKLADTIKVKVARRLALHMFSLGTYKG